MLSECSYLAGKRNKKYNTYPPIPHPKMKNTTLQRISITFSISLHRDKFPSAPAFGVREEVVYQMKKEQESHNAHDVEYTSEDDVENLH